MPMVLAASTIRVPAGTVTFCPSMVRLISGTGRDRSHVAFVSQRVIFVFLSEMPERGVDHPTGGVAQTAQAPAVLQAVGDPEQHIDLDLRALRGQDALERTYSPLSPHAALPAFAARVVRVQL